MADLKQSWKQTGKSVLLALNDLGVSLIDTAKAGYDVAMEWAKKDNIHIETEGAQVEAPVEEAPQATAEPQETTKE